MLKISLSYYLDWVYMLIFRYSPPCTIALIFTLIGSIVFHSVALVSYLVG